MSPQPVCPDSAMALKPQAETPLSIIHSESWIMHLVHPVVTVNHHLQKVGDPCQEIALFIFIPTSANRHGLASSTFSLLLPSLNTHHVARVEPHLELFPMILINYSLVAAEVGRPCVIKLQLWRTCLKERVQ